MIGQKIKTLRKLKGFSQEQMAEKLNMPQNSYSRIETGNVKLDIERLQQISNVFEMSIEDVLNFNDNLIFNQKNYNNSIGYVNNNTIVSNKEIELYEKRINELQDEVVF